MQAQWQQPDLPDRTQGQSQQQDLEAFVQMSLAKREAMMTGRYCDSGEQQPSWMNPFQSGASTPCAMDEEDSGGNMEFGSQSLTSLGAHACIEVGSNSGQWPCSDQWTTGIGEEVEVSDGDMYPSPHLQSPASESDSAESDPASVLGPLDLPLSPLEEEPEEVVPEGVGTFPDPEEVESPHPDEQAFGSDAEGEDGKSCPSPRSPGPPEAQIHSPTDYEGHDENLSLSASEVEDDCVDVDSSMHSPGHSPRHSPRLDSIFTDFSR